jgi:hypothetical protein
VTELICIKCPSAVFLDPKKEICYKTGGLYCKKLKQIVGKYDRCHLTGSVHVKDKPKKGAGGRAGLAGRAKKAGKNR